MSIRCPATRECCSRPSTPRSSRSAASANLDEVASGSDAVDVILFNGNFNHSTDIQGLLETVRPHVGRRGRVVVALYNWYFAWLFRLADRLGLRQGPPIITFITQADLDQLARLAGFEAGPPAARSPTCRGISSGSARC